MTTEDCRRYGLRAIRYDSLVCENPSVPKQAVTHIEDLSVSIGRQELIKIFRLMYTQERLPLLSEKRYRKDYARQSLRRAFVLQGQIGYGKRQRQRLKAAYYMMQDVDYQIFDTVENELIPSSKRKDESYLQQAAEYLHIIDLWEKGLTIRRNFQADKSSGSPLQRLFERQAHHHLR